MRERDYLGEGPYGYHSYCPENEVGGVSKSKRMLKPGCRLPIIKASRSDDREPEGF